MNSGKESVDLGYEMSHKTIPSKEDFARAKAAMKKNDQGLSEVKDRLLNQFGARGVRELFVLFSPASECFRVYVFYELTKQIEEVRQSRLAEEIKVATFESLESVGRGSSESLNVKFEFDSHENVEKNHGGNYYDRLQ